MHAGPQVHRLHLHRRRVRLAVGLASVKWSLNGGAAATIAAGESFSVAKGKVVVTTTDSAGNVGTSPVVTLAERKADAHDEDAEEGVTPRATSNAVLLKGKASASARLVGQLALPATPSATTVDLRPLALGKGTFQLVIKVTVNKKGKTVTKTQKTVKGYSKRVTFRPPPAPTVKVQLTVKKKSGKRWTTFATASAKLWRLRVDVPGSLETIVSSDRPKGASCPKVPEFSSSPTRLPRRPRCWRRCVNGRPAGRRRSRCSSRTPRTACTSSSTRRTRAAARPKR